MLFTQKKAFEGKLEKGKKKNMFAIKILIVFFRYLIWREMTIEMQLNR